MHKNTSVIDLDIHRDRATVLKIGTIYDPLHIPVGIRINKGVPETSSLNAWWQGRSIPASRSGLREALELLNVPFREQLIMKCFGLSLSDQYWINDKNNPLEYSKINFFENHFSEDVGDALFGIHKDSEIINLISPDNTSDGWLKKKWKIIDGKRCLIKSGSEPFMQEPLNEKLASIVQERLGLKDYVNYQLIWENDKPYSICENFITPKTELVSAFHISQVIKKQNHISAYDHFVECCEQLQIPCIKENLDYMLVVDYIIANSDRHYNNFGAIRDAETLKWIGFAPLFDCGTSMWHNKLTNSNLVKNDESKPFKNTHKEQIKLVDSFDWINFDALKDIDDECRELYKTSPFIDEQRCNSLCHALKQRVEMLEQIALEQNKTLDIGRSLNM
jgi:hypothetical protein